MKNAECAFENWKIHDKKRRELKEQIKTLKAQLSDEIELCGYYANIVYRETGKSVKEG